MKSARWTVISVGLVTGPRPERCRATGTGAQRRRGDEDRASRWNPVERSGVHTGVCRVPDPRPSPYRLHRGPLDGGPVHRKIRPPGASRRRATDNHVTLLPYRYRSRRHNTARRTYHRRYAPLARLRKRETKKSSSILVTNRFDIFLLLFIQPRLSSVCEQTAKSRRCLAG